ncbi:MAG: hypothetical protein GY757_34770 [bacterium]|nr:hypothetical protein [bacterium]
MSAKKIILYIFIGAVLSVMLAGQEQIAKKEVSTKKNLPPALFDSDEVVEITFIRDIKAIKKEVRKEERVYHPAQIIYKDPYKGEITLNVKVKSRGKSRRNPRLCDSPPIAMKFDKKETKGTIFRKQKKLKLVTHCKNKVGIFEQYLLREYTVYKLFNLLTDRSFRVRLVRIKYLGVKKKKGPTKYGFFIEDAKKMAKRNNGKLDETDTRHWEFDDSGGQILFCVFQFLAGNTDWSIPVRHNLKILDTEQSLYAVPYDFDLTCLVHTYYAKPDIKLQDRITNVCSRLYRGYCRKKEELSPIFALFNEKKKEIYALYKNSPHFKKKYKKETHRFLDKFYKIINDPKLVKKHFIDSCKKR